MTTIYVGTSALAGRTFGKRQVMSLQPGLQVIGWMNELERLLHYRLTISEANRSRPDQRLMRNAFEHYETFGSPWAALAAPCFTSTHDEKTHGDAVDMAGPGGRKLTQYEHDLTIDVGRRFGIIWTGETFPSQEWWHFNAYPDRASIIVPRGTYISGASTEKPKPIEEDPLAAYSPAQLSALMEAAASKAVEKQLAGSGFQVAITRTLPAALDKSLDIVKTPYNAGDGKTGSTSLRDLAKDVRNKLMSL